MASLSPFYNHFWFQNRFRRDASSAHVNFENDQKELKEKCWLLLHKNKVVQFFFPRRLGFRAPSPKSAAAIFNFQKSKIVFYTLSTYPFLLLGNPTGDFLTETEPLGGRLGGPLVSFQQVSTRALRAQKFLFEKISWKKTKSWKKVAENLAEFEEFSVFFRQSFDPTDS